MVTISSYCIVAATNNSSAMVASTFITVKITIAEMVVLNTTEEPMVIAMDFDSCCSSHFGLQVYRNFFNS